MQQQTITAASRVWDLLTETPALVDLFLELHLDCVGCSMEKFCTIEEVSSHYDLDFEPFLQRIQERIQGS